MELLAVTGPAPFCSIAVLRAASFLSHVSGVRHAGKPQTQRKKMNTMIPKRIRSSITLISIAALLLPIGNREWAAAGSGAPAVTGSARGEPSMAPIASLMDAAVDSCGNVFRADPGKNTILKTAPDGAVTNFAGKENERGSADGIGSNARFNHPLGVAIDASGNLFVADSGNHTIRKVTFAGVVTTLAGCPGDAGNADRMGTDARFSSPHGVAVDLRGNLLVADCNNHSIRRISSHGVVTTMAGAGRPGYADGTGSEARFSHPTGVALDGEGTVFVTDSGNHLIRKVSTSGVVTTIAGKFVQQSRAGALGAYADGTGNEARFNSPSAITAGANGDLFINDAGNHKLRKITQRGEVTTVVDFFVQREIGKFIARELRDELRGGFDCSRRSGRPTGTYIYGGIPSPGDIDVRPGSQNLDQSFRGLGGRLFEATNDCWRGRNGYGTYNRFR